MVDERLKPPTRRTPSPPCQSPSPKLALVPDPAAPRPRHHHRHLADEKPQRRLASESQPGAVARDRIPEPFQPLEYVVRVEDVLEPALRRGDDVHFLVGDGHTAFGAGFAFCGAAPEGEESSFGGDVAGEAEEEEREAEEDGWDG